MKSPVFLLFTGIPGVGKLTISKKIIDNFPDFALVHNHLTLDVASQVFSFGTPQQAKLHNEMRLLILQHLFDNGKNIVYTTCYSEKKQKKNIERIIQWCKQYGYVLKYVHLTANNKAMKIRIVGESRNNYGKLQNFDELQVFIDQVPEMSQKIDWIEGIEIDTTDLSIEETEKLVKEYVFS